MEEVRFQPLFFGRYLFTFTLAFLAGDLLYVLIDAKAAFFGAIIGAALLLVASFFFSERKKKQLFLRNAISSLSANPSFFRVSEPFSFTVLMEGDTLPKRGEKGNFSITNFSFPSSIQKADGVDLIGKGEFSPSGTDPILSLVEKASSAVSDFFGEGREGGFLKAILLGDKEGLALKDEMAFRKTASSHLLAVSGLHVSGAMGVLICLSRLFPMGRKGKNLILIPLLFFLFAFMGASVSVFRATVMTAFPLAGILFSRRSDSLTALLFSAFLLVLGEPFVLKSPSFVLSFVGTFAIIWAASPLLQVEMERLLDGGRSLGKKISFAVFNSFVTSFLIFLFQIPFLIWFFGSIQMFSSFYAVLTIPLFAPCFTSTLFAAILSPVPFAGDWVLKCARFLAEKFLSFHRFLALGAPPLVEMERYGNLLAVFTLFFLLGAIAFRMKIRHLFLFGLLLTGTVFVLENLALFF